MKEKVRREVDVVPEYRSVLAADIAGSGGRGDEALTVIREVLFTALREALAASQIEWKECLVRDTGDGVLLILPPGVVQASLLYPLVNELAARLRARNRLASALTQVRVRLVLHAGGILLDPVGTPVGHPLEVTARLLDSAPLREALAAAGPEAPVAVLLSPHFYDETVPHGHPGIDAESFRRVTVLVKEYAGDAWLWLPPGPGALPVQPPSSDPASDPVPEVPQPPAGGISITVGRDMRGPIIIGDGNAIPEGE